jgi:D-arabinose 5-phosphate isomerase GutQ
LSVLEYDVPAVAPDNDVVAMISGGGGGAVMVTSADADLVESAALVAITVAVESAVTVDA